MGDADAEFRKLEEALGQVMLASCAPDLRTDPAKYVGHNVPMIKTTAQRMVELMAPPADPVVRKLSGTFAEHAPPAPAPLDGVVCFIDIRILEGEGDSSDEFADMLRKLGATVVPKLKTKGKSKATHLVFKDGERATYEKARSEGLHIVSAEWALACERAGERVDEKKHAVAAPAPVAPAVRALAASRARARCDAPRPTRAPRPRPVPPAHTSVPSAVAPPAQGGRGGKKEKGAVAGKSKAAARLADPSDDRFASSQRFPETSRARVHVPATMVPLAQKNTQPDPPSEPEASTEKMDDDDDGGGKPASRAADDDAFDDAPPSSTRAPRTYAGRGSLSGSRGRNAGPAPDKPALLAPSSETKAPRTDGSAVDDGEADGSGACEPGARRASEPLPSKRARGSASDAAQAGTKSRKEHAEHADAGAAKRSRLSLSKKKQATNPSAGAAGDRDLEAEEAHVDVSPPTAEPIAPAPGAGAEEPAPKPSAARPTKSRAAKAGKGKPDGAQPNGAAKPKASAEGAHATAGGAAAPAGSDPPAAKPSGGAKPAKRAKPAAAEPPSASAAPAGKSEAGARKGGAAGSAKPVAARGKSAPPPAVKAPPASKPAMTVAVTGLDDEMDTAGTVRGILSGMSKDVKLSLETVRARARARAARLVPSRRRAHAALVGWRAPSHSPRCATRGRIWWAPRACADPAALADAPGHRRASAERQAEAPHDQAGARAAPRYACRGAIVGARRGRRGLSGPARAPHGARAGGGAARAAQGRGGLRPRPVRAGRAGGGDAAARQGSGRCAHTPDRARAPAPPPGSSGLTLLPSAVGRRAQARS